MSCFKCCELDEAKRVSFNNVVKIIYFDPTPVEMSVSWQQVACDRQRFKRRALEVERIIGWVFQPQHRRRVFDRYCINECR